MVFEQLSLSSAPPLSGDNYSAEHGCFEGPEKLLEIWFSPQDTAPPTPTDSDSDLSDTSNPPTPRGSYSFMFPKDLRTVEKSTWDSMLATVKCSVLSVVSNAYSDAYLLSESAMFVYSNRLVVKTCGTTTLLKALPYILEIARTQCGYDYVYRLFYSRKSFNFPDKQPGPHRSWEEEVSYLDDHFDNGAAYVIGNTKQDEWYLYLTAPVERDHIEEASMDMDQLMSETNGLSWMSSKTCTWKKTSPPSLPPPSNSMDLVNRFNGTAPPFLPHRRMGTDETIEILMTGLDRHAMRPFYQKDNEPAGLVGGLRVDRETGLDKIYPQAKVNSYLFEPCGYSANGLMDQGYYTIHVTPEPQCSYASFETTIPTSVTHPVSHLGKHTGQEAAVRLLIRQVLDIFQPEAFTITYFSSSSDDDEESENMSRLLRTAGKFGGYKRKDRVLHAFQGYDLVYGHYNKIKTLN
ncbi:S-adenosylmethionine decarboxylase [Spinellus fusiger]|nr:S-adenosylmethionine decarboxylase [Spinellus fusiger]